MESPSLIGLDGLKKALREAESTEEDFQAAIDLCLENIAGCEEALKTPANSDVKEMYVGLCAFFLEAAKQSWSETAFVQALKDATEVVDSKRIPALTTAFRENLAGIRSRLNELGTESSRCVEDTAAMVRCRLVSTEVEKLSEADCLVKLSTSGPTESPIQFACSLTQLEDLVWTLRHANKVIEQHAQ